MMPIEHAPQRVKEAENEQPLVMRVNEENRRGKAQAAGKTE